jgi:hypothetical protein
MEEIKHKLRNQNTSPDFEKEIPKERNNIGPMLLQKQYSSVKFDGTLTDGSP